MKKPLTILRILTVHCDEIIPLVSQECDGELTFLQKLAVRTHLLCCSGCRRFKKQLALLRETLNPAKGASDSVALESGPTLSQDAKDRIRSSLKSSDQS